MAYLYLALAIIAELCGTSFLKYSMGFAKAVPSIASLLAYSVSFFFFSKALLYISLSIAYATWCALGVVGATMLSLFLFKEELSAIGITGIVFIIVGVVLVNLYGTSH